MSNNSSNSSIIDREKMHVRFDCRGTASGEMRNDLAVSMVEPLQESFELATDEGPFHGGDATAPPPLALFVGGLTGCIMTQIRAFSKGLGITLNDLQVDVRVVWNWQKTGKTYVTAPQSFEIDIDIDSPDEEAAILTLIEAAKEGCFIEQTLKQPNVVKHRYKTASGWKEA
jgi:uncharacterized OsmC-like protein